MHSSDRRVGFLPPTSRRVVHANNNANMREQSARTSRRILFVVAFFFIAPSIALVSRIRRWNGVPGGFRRSGQVQGRASSRICPLNISASSRLAAVSSAAHFFTGSAGAVQAGRGSVRVGGHEHGTAPTPSLSTIPLRDDLSSADRTDVRESCVWRILLDKP